ncbi:MAG: hypothetical protein RL637_1673 [Pseudomonadota bacterium]|jgi:predicted phosphodiesterase
MIIQVIGSIDQQTHYDAQDIAFVLTQKAHAIAYHHPFTKRSSTQLYIKSNTVVKLRTDLILSFSQAQQFLSHTLKQQRQLAIHHPAKTWFLMQVNKGYQLGNICPQLKPLPQFLAHSSTEITLKFNYILRLYRCYFQIMQKHRLRLDEDLSNFGVDINGQLYYLDDDIYHWDHFVNFSHTLALLIRSNLWLSDDHLRQLGHHLYQSIQELFSDKEMNLMVARKLQEIAVDDLRQQRALQIIIQQFQIRQSTRLRVSAFSQDLIAIISDIHANFPALEAVLNFLNKENIDQGIVLGDIVGYGPHPKQCIERLQQTHFKIIKGNHDYATTQINKSEGMSKIASWCIDWTKNQLTQTEKKWLNDLPVELNSPESAIKSWRAVHGSPNDPHYFYEYVYQLTYLQNLQALAEQKIAICFHGHSHVQGLYVRQYNGISQFMSPTQSYNLNHFVHSLVCPGAVGQPRDGCIGAQLALYHQRTQQLQFIVVDYPMEKTIHDLQTFGFPEILWLRLRQGS